jgi:integrase
MTIALTQLHLALPDVSPGDRRLPSFADALAAVQGWEDVREAIRREMASALRTMARLLGCPLATVPCDVAWLNERVAGLVPAAHGIGEAHYRNVLSRVRGILRRLGCHAAGQREGRDPLPLAWKAVVDAVPNAARRQALARFARFCAGQGVAPEAVTDAELERFARDDRATRLSDAAASRARTLAQGWNACVRAGLPGWPSQLVKPPLRHKPYALPLTAYPPSFQEDVERFRGHLAGTSGTFVLSPKPRRRLRPATVDMRIFAIRQAAGLLVQGGLLAEEIRSLRDLVVPQARVVTVLDTIAERQLARSGGRQAEGGQLATVAETLRQIAAHHVGLDPASVAQLAAWRRQAYGRPRQGLTAKNRDRLRALVQLPARAVLLHLPAELMRRAKAMDPGGRKAAARLARLAVALEILLVCPLRRRSLLALRLDEHLQRLDPRSRRITHLVLQGEDTKTGEPLEWPLPPAAAALIETYLRDFRPCLAAPDNPHLLPGDKGAFHANRLAQAIRQAIQQETGVAVNPHLLRHFAAWLHLQANPGAYEDVRRALGHRSLETTMNHYVGFETAAAAERFDTSVLRERQATRAVAAAKWGRRPRAKRGSR